jgi:hypothetical protein
MADRKELLRRYKETPRPAGIYSVRNTVEGKALVGSSVNVPGMLNRLRFQLEASGCPIREMQADWDRLGEGAFAFEMLDTLEPPDDPTYDPAEDLAELLGMWIDRLDLPAEKLYSR